MSAPDMIKTFHVGADMLCVPDNTGTDTAKLGLSIQCSPMWIGSDEETIGDRFTAELAKWPGAIHAQQAVEIFVTANMNGAPVLLLANSICVSHGVMKQEWRQRADILWAKAFRYEKDQPADFEPLWLQLEARAKEVAALSEVPLRDRQTAMMVDFIEQLREAGDNKAHSQRMDELWSEVDKLLESGIGGDVASPSVPGSTPDYDRTKRLQKAINAFVSTDQGPLSTDERYELVAMFSDFLAQFSQSVDKGDEKDESEEHCPTPQESAEIKLNAILDVPSLAHFFGCGIYVDLDPAEIIAAAGQQGFIAARFAPPSGSADLPAKDALVWTAYAIDLQDDLQRFVPRAQIPASDNLDYFGEFLNLHQMLQGQQGLRYRLSQVSPEASVLGEVVARQIAKNHGRRRDAMALVDDARRRGIALWDKLATPAELGRRARFAEQDNVNYLADLIKGVRPDIQANGGAMHCPTTRSIRCEDPEFPQAFYRHDFVRQFLLYRDHACTQDLVITQGQTPEAEKRGALFIYLGEPIGLGRDEESASNRHRTVSTIEACRGLALKIEFGPDSTERLGDACPADKDCAEQLKWPTLREGSGYMVGCRLAYVNGAGPGRDYMSVRKAYASGVPTLGSSGTQALPFDAVQVEPPRVLLHQFDKVVQRDRRQFPGSSANSVVLAHDDKQFRVVLPPAFAWDQAEQQSQFDGINDPSGVAAFGHRLLLDVDGFSLPEARYRGLYFVDGNTATQAVGGNRKYEIGKEPDTWVDERQSLGPVAHFTPNSSGEQMYFVDRNAVGFTVAASADQRHSVTYRDGLTPQPRVLAIRRVARTVSDVAVNEAWKIDIEPGSNVTRMDGAAINVPAGRKIDVELIPVTKTAQNTLRKTILTIVSPIMRPAAPSDGKPVGVSARYVDAPDPQALELNLSREVAPDKGKPMATVALFEGNLEVDARATGKLILDVAWEDWSAQGWYPDCVKKQRDGTCAPENTAYRFATKRPSSPLATIDAEFADGSDQRKPINLADCVVDNGQRKVTLPFNEGLARAIDLTVTAESEFASYYPGADAADTTSSVTLRVDLACTFRGKQLQIASDDPMLKWETLSWDRVYNSKGHFEGKRGEKRRIYLEGELFVTGIGECAGVIVPRGQQMKRMAGHEGFAKFVSESGIDPYFEAGTQPAMLTPDMLGGHSGVERDVVIVINDDQQNRGEGLVDPFTSDVVLFEYRLDEEMRPYIEIDVSALAEQAHRPVLHLGLVRFQPNALNRTESGGQKRRIDLRASKPIREDVKLLPARHYRWDYDRGNLDVWLKGEMVDPANVVLHRYAWAWTGDPSQREWCWELVDTLPCIAPQQEGKVVFRAKDLSRRDVSQRELRKRLPNDFRTLFRIEENETYTNVESKGSGSVSTFFANIYPYDKYLPD
ncbi:MAG: hypothetical protein EOP62_18435 [Sphingomonadales bacterium]|nr:MAG: hypothetical protein EOP62_18435 [Sphingomonadales bacterium]